MASNTTTQLPRHEAGAVITAEEYERLALEDPDHTWELHHGRLREKPGMTVPHNRVTMRLGKQLLLQLDESEYEVRIDMSRVRHGGATYYVPDLFVVPTATVDSLPIATDALEVFGGPLPLVVEVWSPSTGDYDVNEKVGEYERRGDVEIWRIHPYERTLTAWRRQPDGTYIESLHTGGAMQPIALPHVTIDLAALFAG